MIRRLVRRRRSEAGSVLPFFALILFAMMGVAALVVDLGQIRMIKRTNQTVADLAALAAGGKLSETNATASDACYAALAYLKANAPDLPATVSMSDPGTGCPSLPFICDDASPPAARDATATGGGTYTVTVRYPVPASEIRNTAYAGGVGARDGDTCQRMKVTVRKTQPTFFAGVLGASELTASASAVVRRQGGESSQIPALWLLDPNNCTSLSVTGGANLQVGTLASGSAPAIPGLVTIDSDGSNCGGSYTVAVGGAGTTIRAIPQSGSQVGAISLFALPDGATACVGSACNAADVTAGLISPQPVSQQPARATRAPVDHRWNCKRRATPGSPAVYPVYRSVVSIPDCPYAATRGAYVDQLKAAVGTAGTLPTGFPAANVVSGNQACSPSGNVTYTGPTWVNCSTFKLAGNGPCGGPCVTFDGNVVFEGDVSLSGGSLKLNNNNTGTLPPACATTVTGCAQHSNADATYAYFRNGSLLVTGGQITLNHTAVYQANGYVKVTGGSPPVWTAPTAGPFDGLALWSEMNTGQFTINGGGSLKLGGVFFTPEASPFKITGGAPTDQFRAQFVSAQMAISGNGLLQMAPDPSEPITLPPKAAFLIR